MIPYPRKSTEQLNMEARALLQRLIDSSHSPADASTVLIWALAMLLRRTQQDEGVGAMGDESYVDAVNNNLRHALAHLKPAGLIVVPQ